MSLLSRATAAYMYTPGDQVLIHDTQVYTHLQILVSGGYLFDFLFPQQRLPAAEGQRVHSQNCLWHMNITFKGGKKISPRILPTFNYMAPKFKYLPRIQNTWIFVQPKTSLFVRENLLGAATFFTTLPLIGVSKRLKFPPLVQTQ